MRGQWLASWGSSPTACVARTDAGINSFQEVMDGREWIIATEAPGTTTHDVPSVLKAALGANLKMVPGYDGTSKLRLAVESKEVDGACWSWDSIKSSAGAWFDASPPTKRPRLGPRRRNIYRSPCTPCLFLVHSTPAE